MKTFYETFKSSGSYTYRFGNIKKPIATYSYTRAYIYEYFDGGTFIKRGGSQEFRRIFRNPVLKVVNWHSVRIRKREGKRGKRRSYNSRFFIIAINERGISIFLRAFDSFSFILVRDTH